MTLVADMVEAGLKPDGYTYAAILNACQRANEAELAFEVFRWGYLRPSDRSRSTSFQIHLLTFHAGRIYITWPALNN